MNCIKLRIGRTAEKMKFSIKNFFIFLCSDAKVDWDFEYLLSSWDWNLFFEFCSFWLGKYNCPNQVIFSLEG